MHHPRITHLRFPQIKAPKMRELAHMCYSRITYLRI